MSQNSGKNISSSDCNRIVAEYRRNFYRLENNKNCVSFKWICRYRGLMLDTARNYFSVETIERTLIGMSHAKMNRFHWHISDSQSFPYVSKAYPQLAKYGAYSDQEVYTASDIKSLTEFARVRGIQILPEIDAPAHIGSGKVFTSARSCE